MNMIQILAQLGQDHLIELYKTATNQQKQAFETQIKELEHICQGGLCSYRQRAIKLLNSPNPYQISQITQSKDCYYLDFDNLQKVQEYQNIGINQIPHTIFVLVAGGLGQRLGYPEIKIKIPFNLLTQQSFLEYYTEYIKAFQSKYSTKIQLPLVIMTSQHTHNQTIQLLNNNHYFGLNQSQVILLKQDEVPAFYDNHCHFSVSENLHIQTKPHGHGDIHRLLYKHNLLSKWLQNDKKWVVFFQDTNPLVLRCITGLLGITQLNGLDFNMTAVKRKPGQAMGAIVNLKGKQKETTLSVEYNFLQGLHQEVDQQGYSRYPGNINCLVLNLKSYCDVIDKTNGFIPELVNPKYADKQKTLFKSPTRLECLMQDYAKLLLPHHKISYTVVPRNLVYCVAKNNIKVSVQKYNEGLSANSIGSCEALFYECNRELLRKCGAKIEEGPVENLGGIKLNIWPMIYISPFFGSCLTEMRKKVIKLQVSGKSSLVIKNDCILQNVLVDGQLCITENGKINIKETSGNYGKLVETQGNEQLYLSIRGYKLLKVVNDNID